MTWEKQKAKPLGSPLFGTWAAELRPVEVQCLVHSDTANDPSVQV